MVKSKSIASKNLSLFMKDLFRFEVGNLPLPLFSKEGNPSLFPALPGASFIVVTTFKKADSLLPVGAASHGRRSLWRRLAAAIIVAGSHSHQCLSN
jgi:hypothetical protein